MFEKRYKKRWTDEIFVTRSIKFLDPTEYLLRDLRDENIEGKFYDQELQKTDIHQMIIEKIIRKKNDRSVVKFRVYSNNFNLWIPNSSINTDETGKYIDDDPDQKRGFVGRTIFKEQRVKYRKLYCIGSLEKRMGPIELFKEITNGKDILDLAKYNENLAQCEKLNEEGSLSLNNSKKRTLLTTF